ncbi:MAG TPA: hypothetical protein VF771_11545 [Longimicrobiaceae bacterium]
MNAELDALAAAVNTLRSFIMGAVTEDGRPAGEAPPGGYGASAFAATMLGLNSDTAWLSQLGASSYLQTLLSAASARALRDRMGAIFATATGSANAVTLTSGDGGLTLADGAAVEFITGSNPNTGAVTVDLDGKGALALTLPSGAALTGGELAANSLVRIIYSGAGWRLFTPPIVLTGDPSSALSPVSRSYLETVQGRDAGFRNAIYNPAFDVDQYGALPNSSANLYFIDRWEYVAGGGTRTISRIELTDSDRLALGDEAFRYALQVALTGGAVAVDYEVLRQNIENVRRFAGKTITFSFYARATSGSPFLWFDAAQDFGAGGTPSTPVSGIGGTRFQLSTTWQRFSVTAAMPSLSGKTLGSNANDGTRLNLWFSGGSSYTTRVPDPTPQTATIQLTGVQFEEGSRATPLEWRPHPVELALCQRYYYLFDAHAFGAYSSTGAWAVQGVSFPVPMRATPTIVSGTASVLNATDNWDNINYRGLRYTVAQGGAAGNFFGSRTGNRASAEL